MLEFCGAGVLILEEKLRESERHLQELRRANALLRQSLAPPASTSIATQTASAKHPCFGELLADLGFKKIYRASARTLVNTVPIWAKQRACNEGRVDEIVKAKAQAPSLMGPIMCFEFGPSEFERDGLAMPSVTRPQPRAIFDGQHRARAAMRLLSSEAFTIEDEADDDDVHAALGDRRPTPRASAEGGFDDFALIVEVYPVNAEREIKALYLEVNKSESVKEIDLPDAIAPQRKAHIDEACERLRKAFPDMFKPSERCRPPHVHRDTLRNKLFHHAATMELTSADDLVARFTAVNQRLQARPAAQWPERLSKPLEKARAHGFFLGLEDYAWLGWL